MPTLKDEKLKLLAKIVQKATVCVELYTDAAKDNKHLCLYSYFLVTENIAGNNYPFEFVYFVKDNAVANAEWKMFTSIVVVSASNMGEYTYSFEWTNSNINTLLTMDQQTFIKDAFKEHLTNLAKYITQETSVPWGKVIFRDMLLEGGYEASMFIGNQLFNSAKSTEANLITDIATRKNVDTPATTTTTLEMTKTVLEAIAFPRIKGPTLDAQGNPILGTEEDKTLNIELNGAFRISYKQ